VKPGPRGFTASVSVRVPSCQNYGPRPDKKALDTYVSYFTVNKAAPNTLAVALLAQMVSQPTKHRKRAEPERLGRLLRMKVSPLPMANKKLAESAVTASTTSTPLYVLSNAVLPTSTSD
jgi:hypothetical protein